MNIEKAAQKLADCMDYPWEFMPEQGRENMRNHVKAIFEAANSAPTEDVRAVVDEPVARILKHGPRFNGICEFEQARTYAEYSKQSVAESNGYWLEGDPLYRHSRRPVVMPERMTVSEVDCPERINAQGWNACLDEFARQNK